MNSYRSSRLNTECVEAGTVGLESENLILKVQIIVSGDQGTVFMDELPVVGVDHQVAAAGGQTILMVVTGLRARQRRRH